MRHLAAVLSVVTADDARNVAQLLCAWLDDAAAGVPDTADLFGGVRADAEWWADLASPLELEAYVASGLRRIERRHFAERARKRLFVTLWESMGAEDRRNFIARVDPEGAFRRQDA